MLDQVEKIFFIILILSLFLVLTLGLPHSFTLHTYTQYKPTIGLETHVFYKHNKYGGGGGGKLYIYNMFQNIKKINPNSDALIKIIFIFK